jgi:hypothetical protein
MPQLIVIAAIGTIAYIGYRAIKHTLEAGPTLQRAPVPVKAIRLERGSDGIYRPITRVYPDRI